MMILAEPYIVKNTTLNDLQEIFELFEESIHYQEKNGYPVWKNYDKSTIIRDIENRNHYKVIIDLKTAIIFSVNYSDKGIWRDLDQGESVYLHRVVVNPQLKGHKLFGKIVQWCVGHCREKGLKTVRVDTWANNPTIIDYYKSFGFKFVENYTTTDSSELPVHNRHLALALLELTV
jgi:GNAT superfamily N-acetyltransferase